MRSFINQPMRNKMNAGRVRAFGVLVLLAATYILVAMKISGEQDVTTKIIVSASENLTQRSNRKIVDTAVSMLRTGYLVLRMGLGADSRILAQMNRRNKSYSHCGIVMVENGYPFVYHSIGGEDNPDERLRRDSAQFFFSPLHNTALAVVKYDLGTEQLAELKKTVHGYYRSRPKFDMKFDLKTDDALYCAEFVYKAVNKAVGDTNYLKTTVVAGYRFVGVDDLFVNPHTHMVWEAVFK